MVAVVVVVETVSGNECEVCIACVIRIEADVLVVVEVVVAGARELS